MRHREVLQRVEKEGLGLEKSLSSERRRFRKHHDSSRDVLAVHEQLYNSLNSSLYNSLNSSLHSRPHGKLRR